MATMTKFGFDTQFDHVPPPEETADETDAPPAPLLTEDDVAAARAEGFAAGRKAGQADAAADAERRLAEALSAVAEQIGALGPAYRDTLAACRVDAVAIASAIARKTVATAERHGALAGIEETIAGFLPRLLDEPRVVVRVNDGLLDALQERIGPLAESCGYGGGIVLLAEPGLAEPDCRIEWADGGAEKESGALWREVDGAIENYLAALRGPGGTPADAPRGPLPDIDEIKSEEKPDG